MFVVLVVGKEENGKNYNWTFWFGFFGVQEWPFRDAYLLKKKRNLETNYFIVFFGCALFGPSCLKKIGTATKNRKC